MTLYNLRQHGRELGRDIAEVTVTLFKIMIPAIIVIKILEEMGGIELISYGLSPLMGWVGLPDALGLVWATTMLVNIYAGMLVFITQTGDQALTVAQVSVLGGMMLIAHSLPIEVRVAQMAGVRVGFILLLRMVGGLLYGFLLHQLYAAGSWLQQPNLLRWQPETHSDSLASWGLEQLQGLLMVFLIICLLLTVLRFIRVAGIERLIQFLLAPLLKVLGIGKAATSITLIGITLGLSFGGGLLIKEARAGHVSRHDVFSSMAFLALCHSVIEDTILVMLLGAHVSAALWLRLLFAFLLVSLLTRLLQKCSEEFQRRYLVY